MTHKTKGIILRTLKYGETSVITTAYTELFGVQSYIVKGVRQQSKKSGGKAIYFQPAAMLDMIVYHNNFKNLNYIKEYQWGYLYEHVLFDVVKNTVAMYIVEMMQRCLKQPEANPDMFHLVEDTLKQLDKANNTLTGNLPLYFTLHLFSELGRVHRARRESRKTSFRQAFATSHAGSAWPRYGCCSSLGQEPQPVGG